MAEVSPQFRLSVWKPSRQNRRVAVTLQQLEPKSGMAPPVIVEDLMEEIYDWHPGEVDPFVTLNPVKTERFKEILIRPFRADRTATDRVMSRFRDAVHALEKEFPASYASWAATPEPPPKGLESEETALEANVLLMFCLHLKWILATFEHVPGAMVSIQ